MRQIEFIVHRLVRDTDGVFVIGRCARDALRIDDVFNVARMAGADHPHGVSLRVGRILTYRNLLNQLSSGLTAELGLHGELPDEFCNGTLSGDSSLPLFDTVRVLGAAPARVPTL